MIISEVNQYDGVEILFSSYDRWTELFESFNPDGINVIEAVTWSEDYEDIEFVDEHEDFYEGYCDLDVCGDYRNCYDD
jgi:hypothetical protein